jgi:hypothetical protein
LTTAIVLLVIVTAGCSAPPLPSQGIFAEERAWGEDSDDGLSASWDLVNFTRPC